MNRREYDWGTLRAVGAALDIDANDLEQMLDDIDRNQRKNPEHRWCEAPVRRWGSRSWCSRAAYEWSGGGWLCAQHADKAITNAIHSVRRVGAGDFRLFVDEVAYRFSKMRELAGDDPHGRPGDGLRTNLEIYEGVRPTLADAMGKDATELQREALQSLWGAA